MIKKQLLVLLVLSTFSLFCLGSGTVKIWFAGTNKPLIEEVENVLIPEFEKENPGIKVKAEFIPWGELSTKLTTSFAGGIGPDIFMHGQAAIAGFAEKEIIAAIDDYIYGIEDFADFGSTLDAGVYRGKSYFIPVFGSGRLIAYRTDFFQNAGLNPEEPPITWEQLRNYAISLTKKGNNGRVSTFGLNLPVEGVDLQQSWTAFLIQNGGGLFDENLNPIFNSSEGLEALNYYIQLVQKDKVSPDYTLQGMGNVHPLAAGTVAMSYIVLEDLAQMKMYSPKETEKIKVMLPTVREERASFYSFAGFMVSNSTRNKEDTIKVLNHFTSKKSITGINRALNSLPPRQSCVEADFISGNPDIGMFVKGSKYAFGNPNMPNWVQARDILVKYLERAVKGVMGSQDALDSAAKEISALK